MKWTALARSIVILQLLFINAYLSNSPIGFHIVLSNVSLLETFVESKIVIIPQTAVNVLLFYSFTQSRAENRPVHLQLSL